MYSIRVENIGKAYDRNGSSGHRILFSGANLANARSAVRRIFSQPNTDDRFWALRKVSFNLSPGDNIALIGHNGAGKSTLLKLISRVTFPTEGLITVRGRVANMLEIGAGFNPDLSGRENIYLNGSILGLKRHQISKKFDEIVEFSQIGEFLDFPVKRYSSGMYARLAFSVAAHLDSEIVLIDEVLSVGDLDFQRRSFNKIQEISRHDARTVVFVSHNLQMVGELCDRAIVLDHGRMIFDGAFSDAQKKMHSTKRGGNVLFASGDVHVTGRSDGVPSFECDEDIVLQIDLCAEKLLADVNLAFAVIDQKERRCISLSSVYLGQRISLSRGQNRVTIRLERPHLAPGEYSLKIHLFDQSIDYLIVDGIPAFRVLDRNYLIGSGHFGAVVGVTIPPFSISVI